jgi:lipopolysaccharide export system protein LptA
MKTARLAAILLLLPLPCGALDSDRSAPIEVEADRLEVRELENISIYEGNVRLVQGSLQIDSDRMVIHFDDENELTLMEMTGEPAKFRQLDNERRQIYGEAMQIDYSDADSLVIMRKSAYLDHAGDIIRSDLIRLDTETNNIEAGSTESDDRVKMVIKPRQEPATDAAGQAD